MDEHRQIDRMIYLMNRSVGESNTIISRNTKMPMTIANTFHDKYI